VLVGKSARYARIHPDPGFKQGHHTGWAVTASKSESRCGQMPHTERAINENCIGLGPALPASSVRVLGNRAIRQAMSMDLACIIIL